MCFASAVKRLTYNYFFDIEKFLESPSHMSVFRGEFLLHRPISQAFYHKVAKRFAANPSFIVAAEWFMNELCHQSP